MSSKMLHNPPAHLAAKERVPPHPGRMVDYQIDVSPDMSFLEMLDVVNEELINKGDEPIAFDTIAVRASAGPAAWSSTACRTGRSRGHLPFTCGVSRMARHLD